MIEVRITAVGFKDLKTQLAGLIDEINNASGIKVTNVNGLKLDDIPMGTVTPEEMTSVFTEVISKEGESFAKKLLAEYKCNRLSDLTETMRGDFFYKCKIALGDKDCL